MTITKTLKTKLVLGILAAAVSLSLAIGGTLMLFTAQSEEATNVVTLGNADIDLQEATSEGQNYFDENGNAWTPADTDYQMITESNTGITYTDSAVPGDAFAKAPRVYNAGSVPVYVKADGVLTITPPQGADWAEINKEINGLIGNASYEEYFGAYFENVVLGYDDENWDGTPIKVDNNNGNGPITVSGTWYYTENDTEGGYGTLVALDPQEATYPIFTGIVLPTQITNAFKNFKFSFAITAYAVQSENNAPTAISDTVTALDALESVFNAAQ
jgi:predicted ribosomally synthesized peptide with SipW-like signal peptide